MHLNEKFTPVIALYKYVKIQTYYRSQFILSHGDSRWNVSRKAGNIKLTSSEPFQLRTLTNGQIESVDSQSFEFVSKLAE